MRIPLQKLQAREKAQGMIEFALILPLLLVLILGVIEVGRLLFIYSAVATASREAARYGSAAGEITATMNRYQDCNGMRAAARRMGALVGIANSDISIHYDDGDNTHPFGNCPVGGSGPADVQLGDRVVVQVNAIYRPFFASLRQGNSSTNLSQFTISSISRRTVVKDVAVEGTPPPSVMPRVMFSTGSQDADESVGTLTIGVRLSSASIHNVMVPYIVTGSATPGVDHSLVSGTVSVPSGSTYATITLNITDDTLDEFNEQIVVSMGTPANAVKGTPDTHVVTIIDNDEPPVVSFAQASQNMHEADGTTAAGVTLSAVSGKDILVPFSYTSSGVDGTEYPLTTTPLLIPAGSTGAGIFITVIDDNLDEEDVEMILALGPPDNATLGSPAAHSVHILDDDTPPEVHFTWETQAAMEGMEDVVVKVELSSASGLEIVVPIQVSGTAIEGIDYTVGTSFPLVIPRGMTGAEFTVDILPDLEEELDETVVFAISGPTNAVAAAPATHTINITNTVPVPVASFYNAGQSKAEDDGSLTILVALNMASTMDVTVPFTVSGTATSGTDYTLIPANQVSIPAGSSSAAITVYLSDDSLDESDETITLTLGTPVNATKDNPTTHMVTLRDNETAVVSFAVSGQQKREDLGVMSAVVQLSTLSDKDVSVPFSAGGEAAGGADYTLSNNNLVVIPTGSLTAAITITMLDDSEDEEDEAVILTLGAPTNAVQGAPTVHTAYILDNDAAACQIFDDNELVVDVTGKTVSWELYNQGQDTLVLSSLTIGWPASGQAAPKFDKARVNSQVIWDGNELSSPQTLIFHGMANDRVLTAAPATVVLEFTRSLLEGRYDLTLLYRNVTRGADCPAVSRSYTSP